MAVTVTTYNAYHVNLRKALIDLVDDTIKVALCTVTYTPNQDTQEFFSDVTNEITGTGYTAGGETLGTKALTQDDTNNGSKFDAADQVWSTATFTARYAVIYKDTGVAATSPLIGYIDFGEDKSPSAVDFTIAWNALGIETSVQA